MEESKEEEPTPPVEPAPQTVQLPPLPALAMAAETTAPTRPITTYVLTRFVLLRFLGFVYFTAFLVAAHQLVPLIGHDGLTPADVLLQRAEKQFGSANTAFSELPSVFWWKMSDDMLLAVAWAGVALSGIVMCGYANSLIMLVLWALYMSIVHVGQVWYGYGWDIQILETGFLAVFLCPLLDGRPFSKRAPPVVVIWLYRWLIFRIMLGAGLIKIRGDECWRDLTALYYHYETQPVPNPLSRTLHFMPHWFHQGGVAWNHFIELVVPWFAFWPKISRHIAGFLMVSFQVILIFSGNLSFLNWLTIVPCLACFDDSFWRWLLPRFLVVRADAAMEKPKSSLLPNIASCLFAALVVWLSIEPVKNLISSQQVMNASLGTLSQLHLVNTYGAFGTVGKERFEVIIEGTDELIPTSFAQWREYEFKVKPGDVKRRPPVITPYHYRLDWQTWFIPLEPQQQHPWIVHLLWKLLHNDKSTLSLLANNPFPNEPPKFVRVLLYRYKYAPLGNKEGAWWQRGQSEVLVKPVSTSDAGLKNFLRAYGWL